MTCWPNGTKSKPYVSSAFGPRRAPKPGASTYHRGTDFSHTFSTICAVEAGRVVVAGTPGGWPGGGVQVWIQHNGYLSRSLHMRAGSLLVRVGQDVAEGQSLGTMGRTGTATDTHLHFEISPGGLTYNNSGQVDPVPFITARLGNTAGGGSSPEEDSFMQYLNETQQRQMYEALVKGGQSAEAYYTTDAIINILRGEVKKELGDAIASVANGGILYPGAPYLAFPAIANAIYGQAGGNAIDVDEAKLAQELAPHLVPLISASVGKLSDEDIAKVVNELLTEQSKRLAAD